MTVIKRYSFITEFLFVSDTQAKTTAAAQLVNTTPRLATPVPVSSVAATTSSLMAGIATLAAAAAATQKIPSATRLVSLQLCYRIVEVLFIIKW